MGSGSPAGSELGGERGLSTSAVTTETSGFTENTSVVQVPSLLPGNKEEDKGLTSHIALGLGPERFSPATPSSLFGPQSPQL